MGLSFFTMLASFVIVVFEMYVKNEGIAGSVIGGRCPVGNVDQNGGVMSSSRAVIYFLITLSMVIALIGLKYIFNHDGFNYLMAGVGLLILSLLVLVIGIRFRHSKRLAAMIVGLLGLFFIISGIGQWREISGGTHLIIIFIAFIGLSALGVACVRKAYKMWKSADMALDRTGPYIKNKILDCAGPACIRLSTPEEIISLGEAAVPETVDILKNVKSANQGVLTMALIHFAKNGNVQADKALSDIAEGIIQIDPLSFGDVALTEAQLYMAEKKGATPKNLWFEASEFDKTGQYNKAIDNYKKFLEIVPDDLNALVAIGSMHEKAGQLAEAIEWWEKSINSGLMQPLAGVVDKKIKKARALLSEELD